jgi:hypothetical protein
MIKMATRQLKEPREESTEKINVRRGAAVKSVLTNRHLRPPDHLELAEV